MVKTAAEKHFDKIAKEYDNYKSKNSYYYKNLKKLLRSLIPKKKKTLEIGCGTGDLLYCLKPKNGYGIDMSGEMVKIAKSKYKNKKNLQFSTEWPNDKFGAGAQGFDYIFMSDVIEHLESPMETFRKISELMGKKSVFICTMANPIWEPLLMFWERMGWKMPEGPHKRIRYKDIKILSEKAGMRAIKHDYKLLMPVRIPFVTNFVNKYLEKYLKRLAFIEYTVAVRP